MSVNDFSSQLSQLELFLINFALRLTKNREKAKDLVQDTSLRAFRYRDKFQENTNFKGWIATIMRNTFINNYRKEQRRKTVNKPVEELAFGLESKTINSYAGEMQLRLEDLYAVMDRISDLYSVPFLLHYQGYEYQEIAERLDVPVGTVKSRIFTARKKMKKSINALALR